MTIQIITPQFDRIEELEFDWKPENDAEFMGVVKNAPMNILTGLGFGKWETMNNLISENNDRSENDVIQIPIINSDEDYFEVDNSKLEMTSEPLEEDEMVMLFPHEWYDLIPDGFMVTGLFGETYPFKKGESDDDRRFGCLSYGIRRKIEETNKTDNNE